MTRNHLRALMASSIYGGMSKKDDEWMLMKSAVAQADSLLDVVGGRPEDPESDAAPDVKPGDPFFVIHVETSRAISSPGTDRPARPANWFDQQQVALEESLEEIDAAMFSGDSFIDAEGIAYLEWYIGRWVRTLAERRRALQPELEVNEVQPPAPKSRETCGICTGNHRTAMCPEIPF